MKITKYIHSCVVIENDGERLLVDPGTFTFDQGVSVDTFRDVSTILITHNHPDHLDPKRIKEMTDGSDVVIVSNAEIAKVLRDAGVQARFETDATYATDAFRIEPIEAAHEQILADTLPRNTAYLVNGSVLIPGDSFSPDLSQAHGIDLLLLPIMAPWTTECAVFEFAKQVAPKRIMPVHDGYAKDFFLKRRYENYANYFKKAGIVFEPVDAVGGSVELS